MVLNSSSSIGGGRLKSTDKLDFSVGIRLLKHVGDEIHANEPWVTLYTTDDPSTRYPKFLEDLNASLHVSSSPVQPLERIHKVLA
jgi:thymidine phosphorylase